MLYACSKRFAAGRGGHPKQAAADRFYLACIIAPPESLQLHSHVPRRRRGAACARMAVDAAAPLGGAAGRAEDVADETSPTTSPAMAKRQRKITTWSLESADTPQGASSL